MSDAGAGEGADQLPPYRYGARLANEIEARWQDYWDEHHTFWTPNPRGALAAGFDEAAGRPRLYVLDMFPYPSGAGLHVGHPLGYIGTDVYARFWRMGGRNVLHALGYDAFGLPAEQYALETGQHPRAATEANIATMRRQLRALGLGHDSRRSIATTDLDYYRWTQWIFLQIHGAWYDDAARQARPVAELIAELDAGTRAPTGAANPDGRPWSELDAHARSAFVDSMRLAYLDEAPVNWCPGLGTVLANEEVTAEGRSERGNYPVFKRPLRQWKLRITAYADRLLADLDQLDWPEPIKTMQRNWIGRSTGARIVFPVESHDGVNIEVIVNFGSIWGDLGSAGVAAYCASKGAVHNLTRALAMDHAGDGIRVNAVCPGEVNTPMLQSERAEAVTDQLLAQIAATVPMGRLADPDEIARVVCFLASDDASYMTGAMVSVDAGYGAR